MRNVILMVATAALLSGFPCRGWADSPQSKAFLDTRLQTAKNFEMKGDVARAREEYGSAETWYRAALSNDRNHAALYNKLGLVQLKQGEMEAARHSFADAIHHESNYVDALNNLGAVDCLEKKYRPAVRYLKEALALDEQRAVTHLNLAEAWMGQKQIERAMTEYTRALELDADVLNSASNEGVNAQITNPEQRAAIDFLIAKAYAKRGNLDGALDYLGRAKADHYRNLASVYTEPEFSALWKDPRLTAMIKR
ncbi:MAG TPA: tetratricopeptide repeat protein [Acidobacteriaceae bacterium]|jgi:Tfp pilus assembly protein PilF|nr:tetratricopeptide repeat protein [Acidobacteriaceae bacterium]